MIKESASNVKATQQRINGACLFELLEMEVARHKSHTLRDAAAIRQINQAYAYNRPDKMTSGNTTNRQSKSNSNGTANTY